MLAFFPSLLLILEAIAPLSISPSNILPIENLDFTSEYISPKKQNQDYVGNDLDPKAMTFEVIYLLEDGEIWMQCVKWSKKYKEEGNFYDNLRLTILNKQFTIWMDTKAY